MAGRKHHHVWQLLQRGFGSKKFGKNHVWIYERSKGPYSITTDEFGWEYYFYGPENSIADTNITEFENSAQRLIQKWRNFPDGAAVSSPKVLPIIALLEMRSAFLREEFEALIAKFSENTQRSVNNYKNVPLFINKSLERFSEEIDRRLQEAGNFGLPSDIAKEIVEDYLKRALQSDPNPLTKAFAGLSEMITENRRSITKDAQNSALETPFRSIERTKMYSGLQFSISRTRSPYFILPDTSLAFLTDKGCSPFAQKNMRVDFCLVPLSSDALLVGKRKKHDSRTPETFRRALASCAYKAFLAFEDTPNYRSLSPLIGKNAKLVNDSDRRRITRNFKSVLMTDV